VGVQIFLALSAFLLTSLLRAEHERRGSLSIRHFYLRRALRIWPLYYAFIGVMFAITWSQSPSLSSAGLERAPGLIFFFDNITTGLHGFNPILGTPHLWTISLEEQFYLFLPLFLAYCLHRQRSPVRPLIILWVLLVAARAYFLYAKWPSLLLWTSLLGADALVLGTLLSFLDRGLPTSTPWRLTTLILAIAGVAIAWWFPVTVGGWHHLPLYAMIGLGTTLLCRAALHDPALSFLGSRPLRYLGKISFGLYVFHWEGIHWGIKACIGMGTRNWFVLLLISGLLTLAAAILSYELFEKRFLALKKLYEAVPSREP
jgi:peptidoglycan/LPS O-acetylase OafA/YrhL